MGGDPRSVRAPVGKRGPGTVLLAILAAGCVPDEPPRLRAVEGSLSPRDVSVVCGPVEFGADGLPVTDVHLRVMGWPEPVFLVRDFNCLERSIRTPDDQGVPPEAAFAFSSHHGATGGHVYFGRVADGEILAFRAPVSALPAGTGEPVDSRVYELFGRIRLDPAADVAEGPAEAGDVAEGPAETGDVAVAGESGPGPDAADPATGRSRRDGPPAPLPSVRIGGRTWAAANLTVRHYRNGDPIVHAETPDQLEAYGRRGIGAWMYPGGEAGNEATLGLLYNWFAPTDPRGLGPDGWRLPTDAEWQALVDAAGPDAPGDALKSSGGWREGGGGTDSLGFGGRPAGFRNWNGSYAGVGAYGSWWTATELPHDDYWVWMRGVGFEYDTVFHERSSKILGMAVRLIRDEPLADRPGA